jgi:hypothetical protein
MSPTRSPVPAALAALLLLPPAGAAAGGEPQGLPLGSYRAIVERPLFRPDRRPAGGGEDIEQSPVAIPDGAGLRLRFVGTVVAEGRATALVELDGEAGLVRLLPGDRLGDWRVVEVGRDTLLLSDGHDRRRFTLLER